MPGELVVRLAREAHKASGDHAYVQVMKQFGAQFGAHRAHFDAAHSAAGGARAVGAKRRLPRARSLGDAGAGPAAHPAGSASTAATSTTTSTTSSFTSSTTTSKVCTALMISRLEVRDEQSVDVVGHLNTREERMVMGLPATTPITLLRGRRRRAVRPLLRRLLGMGVTLGWIRADEGGAVHVSAAQPIDADAAQRDAAAHGYTMGRVSGGASRARGPQRSPRLLPLQVYRAMATCTIAITFAHGYGSPATAAAPAWRTSTS